MKQKKDKPYTRILHLLEEKGMKNIDLANLTGIKYETLKHYLDGRNPIPEKKLKIIANALNVSVSYLKGEIELKDITTDYINKKTGLTEELITYSSQMKELIDKHSSEFNIPSHYKEYYPLAYEILCDIGLVETTINEIHRTLTYFSDKKYEEEFERVNNDIVLKDKSDVIAIPSTKLDIMDIVYPKLSKKICQVFEEKINQIKKEE